MSNINKHKTLPSDFNKLFLFNLKNNFAKDGEFCKVIR